MVSDDPMGPYKMCNPVLKNPGHFFGVGGNNHHCMFEFGGEYYITYHSRILEENMGFIKGYRCTGIDRLVINDAGEPAKSIATRRGVEQVKSFDPYKETKAVTMSNAAGIATRQFGENAVKYGSGDMIVTDITEGGWISVTGVNFGQDGAKRISVSALGSGKRADGSSAKILVCLDSPEEKPVGAVDVGAEDSNGLVTISADFGVNLVGRHDVYFVFEGEGYEFYSWKFSK